ncbi:MAG: orotidine-5'-phosphate decarboxylase [Desulfurococcaceae archaeon]
MLVIALDPPFGPSGEYSGLKIVEETSAYAVSYKVGLLLVLESGPEVIRAIKETSGKRVIVDFKLADIGDIMVRVLRKLAESGANAVIAHGFVGVGDGVEKLVEEARMLGVDVILVTAMSHRGSRKYLDKHFEELLADALELGVHGVVVPATRPWLIERARKAVKDELKIYAPGVGVQGAEPGSALCAGADYEIVGRYIVRSPDPGKIAREVYEAQLRSVRTCRG